MKKHRACKIGLLVLATLLGIAAIGVWSMFGTQIKAANTTEQLNPHLYAMGYEGDYGFDRIADLYAAENGIISLVEVRNSLQSHFP